MTRLDEVSAISTLMALSFVAHALPWVMANLLASGTGGNSVLLRSGLAKDWNAALISAMSSDIAIHSCELDWVGLGVGTVGDADGELEGLLLGLELGDVDGA